MLLDPPPPTKTKPAAKGKSDGSKQSTLFGLPAPAEKEKKVKGRPAKVKEGSAPPTKKSQGGKSASSQVTESDETQDTQLVDEEVEIQLVDEEVETQLVDEPEEEALLEEQEAVSV